MTRNEIFYPTLDADSLSCTCRSQAEQLARLLPQSSVVKAFNVLSAYSLESGGLQGSKQVREKRVLMRLMV